MTYDRCSSCSVQLFSLEVFQRGTVRVVALQLCPPLQFGPLIQSKCVVIVSSLFDFPTREGL